MGKAISLFDLVQDESEREIYYRSEKWERKKNARLEIDKYKCALCGSTQNLEVHHKGGNYSSFGNEDVQNDLITLCSNCHSEQPSSKKSYLLEDGFYHFEVIDYEVKDYVGSERCPACQQINLSLLIKDDDGKTLRRLYCDLKLVDFLRWKIEHFFKSINLPSSGISYKDNFDNSIGKSGVCQISQYQTHKNTLSNRVEDFLCCDFEEI